MIVVKIGGCNGSGKTSVVRALLKKFGMTSVTPNGGKKPEAYVGDSGDSLIGVVYALGSYENICGGMDGISDKDDRLSLVRRYATPNTHRLVVYEGLITGKTYGAMGAMSEERGQRGRWVYAFMDTPYEVCVERVLGRRRAAGNLAPFDPERTMRSTFKSCQSTARRAAELGHTVLMLNHTKTPEQQVSDILKTIRRLNRGT